MAKSYIDGLTELKTLIKDLPEKIAGEVDAEIGLGVEDMARVAKRLAPGDQAILRGSITANKVHDLSWELVAQASYAGYIEFGTRSKVKIPPGAEEIAAEVRSQKIPSELTAKQAIYNWCKRKGIDVKLWYPIYRSIMVNGISPQPFFFPAIEQGTPKIIENVKRVINRILK